MATATVWLHKDGDRMAISTDAQTEGDFIEAVAGAMAAKIEIGAHRHDWQFQLERWLPDIVELCSRFRGTPSKVVAQRLLMTDENAWRPDDLVQTFTTSETTFGHAHGSKP